MVVWILNFVIFSCLICYMNRLHKHEFKVNKRHFFCYFIVVQLYYLFMCSGGFFLTQSKGQPGINMTIDQFYQECLDKKQSLFLSTFQFTVLRYFPLAISIVVLKLKREDDLLQGISKLDYLLKVSIF